MRKRGRIQLQPSIRYHGCQTHFIIAEFLALAAAIIPRIALSRRCGHPNVRDETTGPDHSWESGQPRGTKTLAIQQPRGKKVH